MLCDVIKSTFLKMSRPQHVFTESAVLNELKQHSLVLCFVLFCMQGSNLGQSDKKNTPPHHQIIGVCFLYVIVFARLGLRTRVA